MVNVINHLSLIGQELEKQHRTLNLEHINLSLKRSLDKSNRTMENGHLMKSTHTGGPTQILKDPTIVSIVPFSS